MLAPGKASRFRAWLVQLRPWPAQAAYANGADKIVRRPPTVAQSRGRLEGGYMTCTDVSLLITAVANLLSAVAAFVVSLRSR